MIPIRIFISSVQKEFTDERAALRDYLRGDALMRRFFEDVPAADRRTDDLYLDEKIPDRQISDTPKNRRCPICPINVRYLAEYTSTHQAFPGRAGLRSRKVPEETHCERLTQERGVASFREALTCRYPGEREDPTTLKEEDALCADAGNGGVSFPDGRRDLFCRLTGDLKLSDDSTSCVLSSLRKPS